MSSACTKIYRLPNALAEEVEGGLNNLEIKLFVVFNFIMTFLHMCEIFECIVGFYPIVFYLAHIVTLSLFSTRRNFVRGATFSAKIVQ